MAEITTQAASAAASAASKSGGSALSNTASGLGKANPYSAIANAVSNSIQAIMGGATQMYQAAQATIQNEANKFYDYVGTKVLVSQQNWNRGLQSIDNSTSNSSTYVTYAIIFLIIVGMFASMMYMKKNK